MNQSCLAALAAAGLAGFASAAPPASAAEAARQALAAARLLAIGMAIENLFGRLPPPPL